MLFELNSLASLPEIVSSFIKLAGNKKHFAIFGAMGAGKTTFIKEVCRQLGVQEVVTSPTFALVNEYSVNTGKKVFHFDFYRIKKEEELFDLGYEDYLYSDDYCFIEWPEKAIDLIPSHFNFIKIEEMDSGKRKIEVDLD